MNSRDPQGLFSEFLNIIRTLRSPTGCPWDRKQTHKSLVPFMIEEAHEAVAAIEDDNMPELAAELGDVLLQIALHAEIASERMNTGSEDGFDITSVLRHIIGKLIHRHPHVFGSTQVKDAQEVLDNWQRIKVSERTDHPESGLLDSVQCALPQLMVAQKLQERAALAGFDWDHMSDVIEKVKEELGEVNEVIEQQLPQEKLVEEMGDLLFAVVNLSRFVHITAEEALRQANNKFKRRFSKLEKALGGMNKMSHLSLEELDLEWDKIKASERADKREC